LGVCCGADFAQTAGSAGEARAFAHDEAVNFRRAEGHQVDFMGRKLLPGACGEANVASKSNRIKSMRNVEALRVPPSFDWNT